MNVLVWLVRAVDRLNGLIGSAAAWLLLPVVFLAFSVVALRYVANIGYPWFSESYTWLNGAIVMLAAAYVLREEGHVRVDLFYRRLSSRGKAWVDLLGVWTLLLPMVGSTVYLSLPIVERSWRMREASPTPDGLGFLFLLKASVLVFCALLLLQGLAMSSRALLTLLGREEALQAGGRAGE